MKTPPEIPNVEQPSGLDKMVAEKNRRDSRAGGCLLVLAAAFMIGFVLLANLMTQRLDRLLDIAERGVEAAEAFVEAINARQPQPPVY